MFKRIWEVLKYLWGHEVERSSRFDQETGIMYIKEVTFCGDTKITRETEIKDVQHYWKLLES